MFSSFSSLFFLFLFFLFSFLYIFFIGTDGNSANGLRGLHAKTLAFDEGSDRRLLAALYGPYPHSYPQSSSLAHSHPHAHASPDPTASPASSLHRGAGGSVGQVAGSGLGPAAAGLSTVRLAWAQIRDNTEREADTHRAFHLSLTRDLVKPLVDFRDYQQRVRDRIQEELPAAKADYDDKRRALESVRAVYRAKADDCREYFLPPSGPSYQAADPSAQTTDPSTSHADELSQQASYSKRDSHAAALSGKRREPDLKTHLNAFVHALSGDSSSASASASNASGSSTPQPKPLSAKGVKAKRDAEEADKAYREAVHELESYRIRRQKSLLAAANVCC